MKISQNNRLNGTIIASCKVIRVIRLEEIFLLKTKKIQKKFYFDWKGNGWRNEINNIFVAS